MSDNNKICPTCHVEYLSKALMCADCKVSLVWDSDDTPAIIPGIIEEATWDNFPSGTILGQLTSDNEKVIEIYIGHLKSAKIRSAVLPVTNYHSGELNSNYSVVFGTQVTGGKAGQVPVGDVVEGFDFILFAPREDYERANKLIQDIFADLHPGQEMGFSQEYDSAECPACGFELKEESIECPDCGLCFG